MTAPTPRDLEQRRTLAALERALDAAVRAAHVQEWNDQIDAVVAELPVIARNGTGALIEFSYTDNVIRVFPEPRLRPGSAALFDLDNGVHCYRDIDPRIGGTP